jgi:hypothetical protein
MFIHVKMHYQTIGNGCRECFTSRSCWNMTAPNTKSFSPHRSSTSGASLQLLLGVLDELLEEGHSSGPSACPVAKEPGLDGQQLLEPHRQPDSCCTLRNTWSCKLQHSTSLLDARFPRNSAAPWRRAWPAVARTSDLSGVRRSIATGNRMCFRDCSFRDSLQLTFWEISQDISCLSSLQCIFPIPKKASII